MIRSPLIVPIALLLLVGCSGEPRSARIAGEAIYASITPEDPDRPVFSSEFALRLCDDLDAKFARAMSSTQGCSIGISSGFSKASLQSECRRAAFDAQAAMTTWMDVSSAPQTNDVKACRVAHMKQAKDLGRALEYQHLLVLWAAKAEGSTVPPYFLLDPPDFSGVPAVPMKPGQP